MVKNNLLALAAHIVITIISIFLFFSTRQICVNSSVAKSWLYGVFFVIAVLLYIFAGRMLSIKDKWYKNLASVVLPVITGLAIFFMNAFSYEDAVTGEKMSNGLYLIYNIAFTPIIDAYTFIFKWKKGYRYWWIIFSFIPTLLIWMGMQLKANKIKKQE